jgi:hypothetical protein
MPVSGLVDARQADYQNEPDNDGTQKRVDAAPALPGSPAPAANLGIATAFRIDVLHDIAPIWR